MTHERFEELVSIVQNDYVYLDILTLKGWTWEFIRRNKNYRTLYEEIKNDIHDSGILKKKNANFTSLKKKMIEKPVGNKILSMMKDFNVKVFISNMDPESIDDVEGVLRYVGIPNPNTTYSDLTNSEMLTIAGTRCVKYFKFDEDKPDGYFESPRHRTELEKDCYQIVMNNLVTQHASDTLYLGISLSANKNDIKSCLDDLLNKLFATSEIRRHFKKWKLYLMVFDLIQYHGSNSSEVVQVLSSAFTNEKLGKEFNIDNYNEEAQKLVDGGYKKYLHLKK